jgi:hypothetical protein
MPKKRGEQRNTYREALGTVGLHRRGKPWGAFLSLWFSALVPKEKKRGEPYSMDAFGRTLYLEEFNP